LLDFRNEFTAFLFHGAKLQHIFGIFNTIFYAFEHIFKSKHPNSLKIGKLCFSFVIS